MPDSVSMEGRKIERRTTERVAMWERLVMMIVAPLITAAIIGVYSTMQTFAQNQAVMQSQMNDMRERIGGIYTRREADRAHDEIFRTDQHQYKKLKDHETRIRKLEGRQ